MPKCIRLRDSRSLESQFSVALTVGLHYGSVLLLCCADSWPPTHRGFAFHDFKVHKSLVPGISDIPMNKTPMDASLSRLFPMALMVATRPSKWTVPIPSRISRLVMSRVSCPRECRFPDAPKRQWRLISATCPLLTDGPDPHRDFMVIDVSTLTTSRISISRWPISRWLNLVQLPQIRRLSRICPRSDNLDLSFLCAPPPEAKIYATPPDPMAYGISE
jgi:hypothetical protein